MTTLKELQQQARNLGFQNVSGMTKKELEKQIEKLQKIHNEGYKRLQYDPETNKLLQNETNREILDIDPEDFLSKSDIIEKLKGYRLVEDMDNLKGRTWYRYINKNQGLLRTGGFVLKNTPEFIALKNVSKRFTFSVKKSDIYLFEKVKGGITPPELEPFFNKEGTRYVLLSFDMENMFVDTSISGIARQGETSRSSIQRVIKQGKNSLKKFYFFRINQEDVDKLTEIKDSIEINNFDPKVLRIIKDTDNLRNISGIKVLRKLKKKKRDRARRKQEKE